MSGMTKRDIKISDKEAFEIFMKGAEMYQANYGTHGVSIRFKYTGSESPYISKDIDTYEEPVNSILVKIIFIDNYKKPVTIFIGEEIICWTVTLEDYKVELSNQTEIYSMTSTNLEPLCPAVLYAEVFPRDKILELALILDFVGHDNIKFGEQNCEQTGIIVMEFAEDYVSMNNLLYTSNMADKTCVYMSAAFLLIVLAAKTGYTHGDFHFNNIFLKKYKKDPKYPYFLTSSEDINPISKLCDISHFKMFKPLLIDFGAAYKPVELSKHIREFLERNEYLKCLAIISFFGGYGESNLNIILDNPQHYGWASGALKPGFVISKELYRRSYFSYIVDNNFSRFKFFDSDTLTRNFDGKDGIMSLLIKSRLRSEEKIKDKRIEYEMSEENVEKFGDDFDYGDIYLDSEIYTGNNPIHEEDAPDLVNIKTEDTKLYPTESSKPRRPRHSGGIKHYTKNRKLKRKTKRRIHKKLNRKYKSIKYKK